MKIGDEVKFLTTTGGGIIKGFQGKDIVLVEDETGFELPVLIKECIAIGPDGKTQTISTKPTSDTQHLGHKERHEENYEIIETKDGDNISVHIAYLANDLKNLGKSNFECYLVNESNYYLSYNYMSQANNGWISRADGTIEPNTKLFVEEFDQEDFNNIERICLQFIAYKIDKPFELKDAVSQLVKIDTTKFYKLHCFKENDFFDENAIIYTIVDKDKGRQEITVSAKDIKEAILSKEKDAPRAKKQQLEKKAKNTIIEVDLHTHEILDTTAGMSSADILEYQIKVFKDIMNENKNKKGQRIVFIHGKGEGVLKNALANELRTNYKTATYQDASFQEYGFGATMVTIR